jgi:hypothetical protein
MLDVLLLSLTLATPNSLPARHLVLHVGSRATLTMRHARMKSFAFSSPAARVQHIADGRAGTSMILTGDQPGKTALTVTCADGHQTVWLIDVR